MIISLQHREDCPIQQISLFPERSGPINHLAVHCKLHLLLLGSGRLELADGCRDLVAPCAWRCDPGERLHYIPGEKWREIAIGMRGTWNNLGRLSRLRQPTLWRLKAPELVNHLSQHILSLASNPFIQGNEETLVDLARALVSASFAADVNSITQPREQALNRIAERWLRECEHDHSIADAAAECGLSAIQFRRCWKARFGLPPGAWLNARRMERAQELLAGPDSIQDIAQQLGYDDQRYFSTVFRKYYGTSPSIWRQSLSLA